MDGVIDCGTCTGELSIEGSTLHTPAWCVLGDLTPLIVPSTFRGKNVVLPGAVGTRPYKRRRDEQKFGLDFVITGVVDDTGLVQADPLAFFETNLAAVETILDPGGATTVSAEIVLPDASTVTAEVQANLKPGKRNGPVGLFTLELIVPAGVFT